MAVITAVVEAIADTDGALYALWETLTSGDSGAMVADGDFTDRSIQLTGTFDGETFTVQGSNDGTNWVTLNDLQGNALSFAAAGLKGIAEATRYIRVLGDGGGTTVDVDALLFAKKT